MPSNTGQDFQYDPGHGKGSHGRVYVGSRFTTVQQGELGRGVLAAMLRQLGIDRREFRVMLYAYPCELAVDEDGAFVATFPDVPEAITGGKDRAEALEMAADALATALAGYVYQHWEISCSG